MTLALGIDIGGTGIKSGLVDKTGAILARRYDPITPSIDFASLLNLLVLASSHLLEQANSEVVGIGLAMPGHVDPETETFIDGGENLAALTQGKLSPALRNRLGLTVLVENDGLAATLGELHFGAGRGIDRFILITLGTGVGGGIFLDGQLQYGERHQPPELGAIVLDIAGPPNAHGQPGTFEAFAGSAGFLAAFAQQGFEDADLPAHFASAAAGDPRAMLAIDTVAFRIAQGVGAVVNAMNLERCIIGGGISDAGDTLIEPIRRKVKLTVWPAIGAKLEIVQAEKGNNAGMLGAASLVLDLNGGTMRGSKNSPHHRR